MRAAVGSWCIRSPPERGSIRTSRATTYRQHHPRGAWWSGAGFSCCWGLVASLPNPAARPTGPHAVHSLGEPAVRTSAGELQLGLVLPLVPELAVH